MADESLSGEDVLRRNETEILQALFSELLEFDDVGLNDDFFDLGGNSLLAMRLVARIEAEIGTRLALRDVFDWPTPAGLAACLPDDSEGPS